MAAIIGPNFSNELALAGLSGLPFSWNANGITFGPTMTSAQQASVNAVLAAHDPTKPDPNAAAAALLKAGFALTSTDTPALNGIYAVDDASQQKITSEQLYIATAAKFTNGQTTRAWLDIANAPHVFPDVAHFTAFAEAVAQFVDAVLAAQTAALAGAPWSPPAAAATIA